MKRILSIGHNDLRLFFKSKTAYIWLFVVPTAMVYFLGFAVRAPGDPYNRTAPVAIDNHDTNFLAAILLDVMTNQGIRAEGPTNAARGVRIPADFTSQILQGNRTKVEFYENDTTSEADDVLAEFRLAGTLVEINSDLLQAITAQGSLSNLTRPALRQIINEPPAVTLNAHFAGRKPTPSGFNFSLPGNLVIYLLLNLLVFGGANTAAGRRNGTLRRMATTPATGLEIVMGKIYGNTLLGVTQIVYFLLIGKFIFHVNLGENLPGVLVILIALAWAAGALGVLAGLCLLSEDRVVPICVLSSLVMGALSGCWWPMETAPPIFRTVAHCLPPGWALSGLHQMISFGSGIQAAVWPALELLGFGAVINLLAVRFFRV